jgi:RNA polymerase sigma-70 factor (ECF subfamily)
LQRYGAAVYRYLLGALRDEVAAEELFQEFALRFVRGDFHRADPGRGRFRDFLKTTLYHLVVDAQRARLRRPLPLAPEAAERADAALPHDESDRQFLDIWRAELLARAWDRLAELQERSGQPLHTVLRFRTDNPDLRSPQMAEQLSQTLGKPVSAEWVRKWLQRARETFSDQLVDEAATSLEDSAYGNLESELIDLGLLDHCRSALNRRSL